MVKYFSTFSNFKQKFLVKVFGSNNDRLDFIIDSFYQFSPTYQKFFAGLGVLGLVGVFITIFYIYFSSLGYLQDKLYNTINGHKTLATLATNYYREDARFQALLTNLSDNIRVKSLKPFFEKVARDEELNLGSLNEKIFALSDGLILAENLDGVQIDVEIDNISLPKILKYLTTIERSRNHLSVSALTIKSRYETKLYFDTKITVKGYRVK